jgi:hypothetical protein
MIGIQLRIDIVDDMGGILNDVALGNLEGIDG